MERLDEIIENIGEGSYRQHVLQVSKNFKTSWMELGQALYAVWKDKLYREWGYSAFDVYTAKEIGLKKQTAMKLLRSYFFLEKEEPDYLQKGYRESANTASLPNFEAVDVLRRAKKKNMLDEEDYNALKNKVLKEGQGAEEVRKDLTLLIKEREELEPEEAVKQKRLGAIKRFLAVLKSIKRDIELLKLFPDTIVKQINSLLEKLESEVD